MKTILILTVLFAIAMAFLAWRIARARRPKVTLGNAFSGQLGEMYHDGEISGIIDAGVALPVGQRYLIYTYGADQYHFKPTTANANYPLGVSPDSPSGTIVGGLSQVPVWLFGAKKGTLIGIANPVASAVTHGNPLVSISGGFVQDLTTVGNGNYWLVGYALKDVTAATAAAGGSEVSFIPQIPRQVTVTAGAISAMLQ